MRGRSACFLHVARVFLLPFHCCRWERGAGGYTVGDCYFGQLGGKMDVRKLCFLGMPHFRIRNGRLCHAI